MRIVVVTPHADCYYSVGPNNFTASATFFSLRKQDIKIVYVICFAIYIYINHPFRVCSSYNTHQHATPAPIYPP
jgi:hypothetical protein